SRRPLGRAGIAQVLERRALQSGDAVCTGRSITACGEGTGDPGTMVCPRVVMAPGGGGEQSAIGNRGEGISGACTAAVRGARRDRRRAAWRPRAVADTTPPSGASWPKLKLPSHPPRPPMLNNDGNPAGSGQSY